MNAVEMQRLDPSSRQQIVCPEMCLLDSSQPVLASSSKGKGFPSSLGAKLLVLGHSIGKFDVVQW